MPLSSPHPSPAVLAARVAALALVLCGGASLEAQEPAGRSVEDSSTAAREAAEQADPDRVPGLHLRVLLAERRLRLQDGGIVLLDVPASIGRPDTLRYGGREWTFATPPGRRVVLGKEADPVWTPPDWHYAERAVQNGWELLPLERGRPIPLAGGAQLAVRGDQVVRLHPDGTVEPLPTGGDIVLGDRLVVPPFGTVHRRIPGELGRFKLDLGDGYLIHGTPREQTIGSAVTHGCVHLAAEHLEVLFREVPVGTPIFTY